jgi:hypothetical protein
MNKNIAVLTLLLATGCVGRFDPDAIEKRDSGTAANPVVQELAVPPLDPKRKVSEQDCSKPVDTGGGNLMCREVSAAEREAERRRLEEEERQRRLAAERKAREEEEARQAKARKEAEEREARARAERERLAAIAAAEAARKAKLAEDARLAAEAKARAEREARERAEAEALARQRAEQEAREAAERERQRLEHEWLAGRAMLEQFIATYGSLDRFKPVAKPISGFLDKTR